jgi:hypothetical protein
VQAAPVCLLEGFSVDFFVLQVSFVTSILPSSQGSPYFIDVEYQADNILRDCCQEDDWRTIGIQCYSSSRSLRLSGSGIWAARALSTGSEQVEQE